MAAIALVSYSTASLPETMRAAYDIHLIPFTIQFIDGNYKEGEELSLTEFYRRLSSAEAVPTTAPTSVAQFINYFRSGFGDAETIVVFHIASELSKAYENAVNAAARVPNRRIINVDSRAFGPGAGLQLLEAARMLADGTPLDTVLTYVEALKANTFGAAVTPSIKYLRLSGRTGRLPAMAATLLGIQPVIGFTDNTLELLARPRSTDAALDELIKHTRLFLGNQAPLSLAIVHTNALSLAERFAAQVTAAFPNAPLHISDAGPITAVHIGPGALGLSVLRTPAR